MPKPMLANDCYYIGLIFPNQKILEDVRYVMLLKTEDAEGHESTVLGEWTNKGQYIELSTDIAPRTDAFFQALVDLNTTKLEVFNKS